MSDKNTAIIFAIGVMSGVALNAAINLVYGILKDEIIEILSKAKIMAVFLSLIVVVFQIS